MTIGTVIALIKALGGGSGGGALVVNVTYDEETGTYTCDKTAGEMWAAYNAGQLEMRLCYIVSELEAYFTGLFITQVGKQGTDYMFQAVTLAEVSTGVIFDLSLNLEAPSASEYPSNGASSD